MKQSYLSPRRMPSLSDVAQGNFLAQGGVFAMALRRKIEAGEISEEYSYSEFPKVVDIPLGTREHLCSTQTVDNRTRQWTENRKEVAAIVVESRAEERQVLEAAAEAKRLGIEIGTDWTAELLLFRVGLKVEQDAIDNAPEPDPAQIKADRVAALKAEIAALEQSTAEPAVGNLEAEAAGNLLASPAAGRPRKNLPSSVPDQAA